MDSPRDVTARQLNCVQDRLAEIGRVREDIHETLHELSRERIRLERECIGLEHALQVFDATPDELEAMLAPEPEIVFPPVPHIEPDEEPHAFVAVDESPGDEPLIAEEARLSGTYRRADGSVVQWFGDGKDRGLLPADFGEEPVAGTGELSSPGEAVNAETGEVTPPGRAMPLVVGHNGSTRAVPRADVTISKHEPADLSLVELPECRDKHCHEPAAEDSRFCEEHRRRLARIRDEMNTTGRRRIEGKRRGSPPTCTTPGCQQPRVPGEDFCFGCSSGEGYSDD